jgi:hypothetical protein
MQSLISLQQLLAALVLLLDRFQAVTGQQRQQLGH